GQGIRLRARVTARCTDLGRLALVRAARKSSILLHGPSLGDGPARGFVAGPRLRSAQLSASPEVGALPGSRRYALRAPPTACVDFARSPLQGPSSHHFANVHHRRETKSRHHSVRLVLDKCLVRVSIPPRT